MNTTGDLTKLRIKTELGGIIEVMFNPNSYSISKSVTLYVAGGVDGKSQTKREVNAPPLQFGGGGSRQLSLELFFDVTEQPGKDVREETDNIAVLTRINREIKGKHKRPPRCTISWGATKGDFPFVG